MRGKSFIPLPAIALAIFFCGAAAGEENQGPKPSTRRASPVKALQTAAKNLAKAQSYRAKCTIEGGLTEREDHAVTERTVGESYEGEVFQGQSGPLMSVPDPKAFRFPKKGVVYIQGAWRNILSDQKSVRLDRLFTFPEIVLARALASAPKGASWLEPKPEDEVHAKGTDQGEDEENQEQEEKPAKEAKKVGEKASPGKTVVSKAKGAAADEGPQPRIVHVDVPPEEALKSFIEAQNSGCMSAG